MTEETVYDGHAPIPPVNGTRHWYDLSGLEQDEYLLSCFKGETTRLATETRLGLYDRIAVTIAHFLLDDHYDTEPAGEREAFAIQVRRTLALENTLLGERLIAALGRAGETAKSRGAPIQFDYSQDPMLFFEYLDFEKTRGFEMLSPDCVENFEEAERNSRKQWDALSLAERERATEECRAQMAELAGGSPAAPALRSPRPRRALPLPLQASRSWIPFLNRFRRPNEVKDCVAALEEMRPLFARVIFASIVLDQVRATLLAPASRAAIVRSVAEAGNPPRDVVLFAITEISSSLLSSGQYHVYRGVLSMEGAGIRSTVGIAIGELVKSGFADEEEAKERRAQLTTAIKEVG